MIDTTTFTEEHIRNLQATYKSDPALIEKLLFAFGVLEAIARTGLPFIFKGGTALVLLLENPNRLSTDIDIIVEPGIDLDDYTARSPC